MKETENEATSRLAAHRRELEAAIIFWRWQFFCYRRQVRRHIAVVWERR